MQRRPRDGTVVPGDWKLTPHKAVFPEELSVMKTWTACIALLVPLLIGLWAAPLAAQTFQSGRGEWVVPGLG